MNMLTMNFPIQLNTGKYVAWTVLLLMCMYSFVNEYIIYHTQGEIILQIITAILLCFSGLCVTPKLI